MYGKWAGKSVGLVVDHPWPELSRSFDMIQAKEDRYIRDLLTRCRAAHDKPPKGMPNPGNRLIIYIATHWPEMQSNILELLNKLVSEGVTGHDSLLSAVKTSVKSTDGKLMQKQMQFASFVMHDYDTRGTEALSISVGFDETEVIGKARDAIVSEFGLEDIQVLTNDEAHEADTTSLRETAVPGKPQFFYYNGN
jgi:hypothetical protein